MAASSRPVDRSALWSGGRETPGARSRYAVEQQDGAGNDVPAGPPERRSLFGRFRRRYGWRVYAMPVLAALTVLLVIEISRTPIAAVAPAAGTALAPVSAGSQPSSSVAGSTAGSVPAPGGAASDAPPTGQPSSSEAQQTSVSPAAETAGSAELTSENPGATAPPSAAEGLTPALAVGALPDGEPFAVTGDGTYRVVPGAGPQVGTSATVVTYTVEIENGFEPAGGDAAFAAFVDTTLGDPRSWTTVKGVSLQRLDSADANPDFRVTLGSQQTVREICGYAVKLESSCYTGVDGRVMINDARWVRGALSYGGDLTSYRQYAVNHEVGHALGYGHQKCSANGGLAPVMMQQSWSTSDDQLAAINGSVAADGNACQANPWPDPSGAEGEATQPTGGDATQPTN